MNNRSPSLTRLIDQAVAGDAEAIQNVLQYLNSANLDLRRMMQGALHANRDPRLWQRLLHCIAFDCWPAESNPAERPSLYTIEKHLAVSRAMQSIIEVFAIDTSPEAEVEAEVKNGVLLAVCQPYREISGVLNGILADSTQASQRFAPTVALQSPFTPTRWAAAYLLGLRGNLRAVPVLDEIMDLTGPPCPELTVEQRVRWQLRAVQALATLNDVTCGPPLIKALASPERTVHHAAGSALGELGRNAEPALLSALHHPDPHVRWHAARGLGQIGDLRAVGTLAEGLYDDNQEVRWAAARVLSNLDVPAIPAVLHVLATQPINEPLRQSAYHALNGMYGLRQPEINRYIQPLMDELRHQTNVWTISPEIPVIAQRMLAEWKNVADLYSPPAVKREERSVKL